MTSTIIVSGSLAYDRIMNFPGRFCDHIMPDKIHVLNLSFEVETVEEKFGGTAGNIAYSLKLLGQNPKIVSALGEDDFAPYQNHLQKNGIDSSFISIIPEVKTAFVSIITDLDDNQIAAFYPGALIYAPTTIKIPKQAEMAIVSPEDKDVMIERVKLFQEAALPYIFDPAQQIIKFNGKELKQCLHGAKVLMGNDYEISLIRQKTGLTIKKILKMVEILVITFGEKGSRIYTHGKEIPINSVKPAKFVDPTGAGDAYRAGFIAGLVMDKNLEECGRIASWTASKAIECYGAQEHSFERNKALTALEF
jgi:adenosine kinase